PAAPCLGWFSTSHLSISSAFLCNFSTCCCLVTDPPGPGRSPCPRSACTCSSSNWATLVSIFSFFFRSSAMVPLNSLAGVGRQLAAIQGKHSPAQQVHLLTDQQHISKKWDDLIFHGGHKGGDSAVIWLLAAG